MQPSNEQLLQVVDALPMFADLSSREKSTLLAIVRARGYQPGEVLCREGDRAFSLFIICRGSVEVFKELRGAKREKLGELKAGSMIGQVSLIDGKPRSATVQAKTGVITLECTRDDFDRLFNAGSTFAFKILDQIIIHLVARLRDANLQLYSLYSRPTETLLKLHSFCVNVQRAISDTHDRIDLDTVPM